MFSGVPVIDVLKFAGLEGLRSRCPATSPVRRPGAGPACPPAVGDLSPTRRVVSLHKKQYHL